MSAIGSVTVRWGLSGTPGTPAGVKGNQIVWNIDALREASVLHSAMAASIDDLLHGGGLDAVREVGTVVGGLQRPAGMAAMLLTDFRHPRGSFAVDVEGAGVERCDGEAGAPSALGGVVNITSVARRCDGFPEGIAVGITDFTGVAGGLADPPDLFHPEITGVDQAGDA